MAVRIVTDSSSGLPVDLAQELGITVVDLHVMQSSGEQSTAGLSALELTAAYARQLERGGDAGVVALHLSKELSSTWSAATQAAAIFDGLVHVVDTQTIGMAVGAAAMAAAKVAAEGADVHTCAEVARDVLGRSETWLYLHRLDAIKKSGRISAATAVVSSALATKPLMRVEHGRLELAFKTRTQSKAFARLVEAIRQRAASAPVFVMIQHFDAANEAAELQRQMERQLASGSSFLSCPLEPTAAVHAGPGAIGVSVVYQRD
ncbi:DegV family protein [Corynebacterium pseudopelargi]|uniref:DegV domain-containing protein n=1 Tax=Corynebacterium pseudopelargi TaxID=2080757 RepID=A0A3G6IX93_9CORY|nr:DegV family protein [Corynebacterium pseudopelargi]AZA08750.1 DegV domain-containing protein [Corynebacterium pseudopelargi]